MAAKPPLYPRPCLDRGIRLPTGLKRRPDRPKRPVAPVKTIPVAPVKTIPVAPVKTIPVAPVKTIPVKTIDDNRPPINDPENRSTKTVQNRRTPCLKLRSAAVNQLGRPSAAVLGFRLTAVSCGCFGHHRGDLHAELLAADTDWSFWIERSINLWRSDTDDNNNGWLVKLPPELSFAVSLPVDSPLCPMLRQRWIDQESRMYRRSLLGFDTTDGYLLETGSFTDIDNEQKQPCGCNRHRRASIYRLLLSDDKYDWTASIRQDVENETAAQSVCRKAIFDAITTISDCLSTSPNPTEAALAVLRPVNFRRSVYRYETASTDQRIVAAVRRCMDVIAPTRPSNRCLDGRSCPTLQTICLYQLRHLWPTSKEFEYQQFGLYCFHPTVHTEHAFRTAAAIVRSERNAEDYIGGDGVRFRRFISAAWPVWSGERIGPKPSFGKKSAAWSTAWHYNADAGRLTTDLRIIIMDYCAVRNVITDWLLTDRAYSDFRPYDEAAPAAEIGTKSCPCGMPALIQVLPERTYDRSIHPAKPSDRLKQTTNLAERGPYGVRVNFFAGRVITADERNKRCRCDSTGNTAYAGLIDPFICRPCGITRRFCAVPACSFDCLAKFYRLSSMAEAHDRYECSFKKKSVCIGCRGGTVCPFLSDPEFRRPGIDILPDDQFRPILHEKPPPADLSPSIPRLWPADLFVFR